MRSQCVGCSLVCAITLCARAIQYSTTGRPSIPLAGVIQTDTVPRGNEHRRQIPSELHFSVIVLLRKPLHINQFYSLGFLARSAVQTQKLSHRRAASWSRARVRTRCAQSPGPRSDPRRSAPPGFPMRIAAFYRDYRYGAKDVRPTCTTAALGQPETESSRKDCW
jgi:hypothetical protein